MRAIPLAKWIQCALLAALTGIFSQILIPIGPIPINLATMAVYIAGGLMGAKYGAMSMLLYVAMGLVGIPVFTMMQAGVAVLAGPRGGYIVGYVAAAWLIGWLIQRFGRTVWVMASAMALGILLCYLLGTLWYLYVTGSTVAAALMTCVIPFLPGDALKIGAAVVLVRRLAPILEKQLTPSV